MSARSVQLVTLVGEPGIGKSRLVYELFEAVERHPELVFWRQGRSLPYGEGVSFWALGEMVKAHTGILETDDEEEADRKLRATVTATVPADDVEWTIAHLRPLAGIEDTGGRSDNQEEAFAAWRGFLEGVADQRPLVLVFEDLHWADDGLLDFVDHLVDWATRVPLLVVATARPELLARRSDWGGGKTNALTLSLAPLSGDETAELVHALLDRAAIPADVQATLLERAGGNPLYAEEFVRLLDERADGAALPETVQGIIAARLDVLDRDEKELLQDAAVLGRVFWVGGLGTRAPVGGGRPASTRATRVRAARAAELRRERDRVRVPARARPRGRVRADPARAARREAPPRRRLARDPRPLRGSRRAARASLHRRARVLGARRGALRTGRPRARRGGRTGAGAQRLSGRGGLLSGARSSSLPTRSAGDCSSAWAARSLRWPTPRRQNAWPKRRKCS